MRRAMVALCILVGSVALFAEVSHLSRQAKNAYELGQYSEAVQLYRQAIALSPDHPDLLFNLGTASFQNGDLGESIVWFLRSEKAAPNMPDLQKNLEIARSRVVQPVAQTKGFLLTALGWPLDNIGLSGWLYGAAISVWLVVLLCWVPVPSWARGAAFGLALLVLLGAGMRYRSDQESVAVVMPDKIVLRAGPSRTVRVVDYLHEGLEVLVKAEYDGWREVVLENGVSGWVLANELELR